jgi:hypothetical protein
MGYWDSYVMIEGEGKVTSFWNDPDRPQGRTLLLMGEGFDPRMNNVLKAFAEAQIDFDCINIIYGNRQKSPNRQMVERNIVERNALIKHFCIPFKEYPLKVGSSNDLNRGIKLMNLEVNSIIKDYLNVIVDISALPKVLYFNLVNAIRNEQSYLNLFIVVSENAEIDRNIKYLNFGDDITPMVSFNPGIGLEAEPDRLKLLIPLLGENGTEKCDLIMNQFNPDEIYPVVPYPSKDPFRTDTIIREYHELFKLEDAKDNIIYAHERNPFELYKMLSKFIKLEDEILGKVKREACYGIALLSSKLLSVGALLIAMENSKEVAIYNVISHDYSIEEMDFKEMNKNSTTFLMWIKGEAYND